MIGGGVSFYVCCNKKYKRSKSVLRGQDNKKHVLLVYDGYYEEEEDYICCCTNCSDDDSCPGYCFPYYTGKQRCMQCGGMVSSFIFLGAVLGGVIGCAFCCTDDGCDCGQNSNCNCSENQGERTVLHVRPKGQQPPPVN